MATLSAEERLELGRMAINTLDEWGLKASDQANVLALPKGTPTRMLRRYVDDTPLPDDPDVLKHVEHLLGIADALAAGAPVSGTLDDIDTAMGRILEVRTEVGARLNAAEDQRGINDSFSLLMEQDKAALTDLDYAEAVSRFNQQLLALQASQQLFAKTQGLSLFNYLG